ncbi:unnamed protein product [Adineta steineri]|uniref:Ferric-chelate reductase 1 n=1 Tax=Adineta steineri TaxID=433720 RepID=A0A813N6H7_9BILA|nr:unnamed protein product [Adineta steineri]CAF1092960.1 unnamed protein product [Adineta steineri]
MHVTLITDPATCSSKFSITSSTLSYTVDEPIHIKVNSTISDTKFIGIHLLAQDEKHLNVGSWKTTDELAESNICDGVAYYSEIGKTNIDAIWQASPRVVGNVRIKAIIIENEKTIYINCYDITLTPRVPNNSSFIDENDSTSNTPPTITTNTTTQPTTTITTTSRSQNTTITASPTAEVAINVTWTFTSGINVTNVLMTIKNLKPSQWAAIGLNINRSMGGTHVFMCKRYADDTIVINRYVNPNKHEEPEPAGSEDGGVLTPGKQEFNEGIVICRFSLSNFTSQTSGQLQEVKPLSQSNKYYPIFAVGFLDEYHDPIRHAKDSRTTQSGFVQLNEKETILYKIPNVAVDLTFARAHGIIMIFTWILIVSTGVLISRYFKNAWLHTLICGKAAWFAAHRFLMSIATILTVLGFLFIFVFRQGLWIDLGLTRAFAHSITGVIMIGLAFFQPFIALFRCEPDSRYRFIFNFIHTFVGFSSLILSNATLFLATYFPIFKDNRGRIILIIWLGWIVFIFTIFQIIQSYYRKKNNESGYTNLNSSNTTIADLVENSMTPKTTSVRLTNEQETSFEEKLKNVLLAIHILVAAILSIMLTTLIL